jgi:glycerol-3-phosphate acyltransferase PlsY
MVYLHTLAVAVVVGKVVLLSFVVAPILAKNLQLEPFANVVRHLFPAYYAFGMGTAVTGVMTVSGLIALSGASTALMTANYMWLLVLLAEAYCRSPLTPQSNAMRDQLKEQELRGAVDPDLQIMWNRLHQRFVFLNSMVLLAGCILMALVR